MGQMRFPSSVPDIELVLYPLQDKLTSRDKSLDLSAFKLSRLFFSLLSSGSFSCWRSYGAQLRILKKSSRGGNPKLCGTPLPKKCSEPSHEPQLESDEGDAGESGFTWEVVMLGYGCGTVLGLIMGYFMLSTRKVKWFNAIADLILKRQ
ncbi:hypothetical protein Tco_0135270 [Tanacetum coccineum]